MMSYQEILQHIKETHNQLRLEIALSGEPTVTILNDLQFWLDELTKPRK